MTQAEIFATFKTRAEAVSAEVPRFAGNGAVLDSFGWDWQPGDYHQTLVSAGASAGVRSDSWVPQTTLPPSFFPVVHSRRLHSEPRLWV